MRYKLGYVWQRQMNKSLNRKLSEAAQPEPEPEPEPEHADAPASRTLGMSAGKSLEYIKRWRALEGRRQDLDYDVSRWCNDVRAEFPTGPRGDAKFKKWIDVELALSETRKAEIVTRVAAFSALPDRAQYESLGGFSHVKKLIPLDKRDRVSVIGEAKASGKSIGGVLRARDDAARTRRCYEMPVRQFFTVTINVTARQFAKWKSAAGQMTLEDWLKAIGNAAADKK